MQYSIEINTYMSALFKSIQELNQAFNQYEYD